MSGDSLFGGAGKGHKHSHETMVMLDKFLRDTVHHDHKKDDSHHDHHKYEDDFHHSDLGNGAEMVVGRGHKGETQGAIVTANVGIAAIVTNGHLKMYVKVPDDCAIAFEGSDNYEAIADIRDYFLEQIQYAFDIDSSDPAIEALNYSLTSAVKNIFKALEEQGITEASYRIIDFADSSDSDEYYDDSLGIVANEDPEQTIVFDASDYNDQEIFVLLLDNIYGEYDVELSGIEHAVAIGDGTVLVGDDSDTGLYGDTGNQFFEGGGGNDTMVGGGGNDTMIGGEGDDTYIINASGHYSIELNANDKLTFQLEGIETMDDLLYYVSDVTESSDGYTTYELEDYDFSIEIVGDIYDITEDLIFIEVM